MTMRVTETGEITATYPPEVLWIKQNKDILNLKAVAEGTKIPVKNLWNYCNNIHSLNSKHWKSASKWVQKRQILHQ